MPVEEAFDTGEYAPVYNLRVADWHTYFVGEETWGFAVWAHNAECTIEQNGDHYVLKDEHGTAVESSKSRAALEANAKARGWSVRPDSEFQGKHPWSPTYREAPADSHHIIQDAAARGAPQIPGQPAYSRSRAPAIQLDGPSTTVGSPHYRATRVQDQTGGGTYGAERRIGYKALRRAGKSRAEARAEIARADRYFIDELGWNRTTPLRIPGNRR